MKLASSVLAIVLTATVAVGRASAQNEADEAQRWAQIDQTDDYAPSNNAWNGLTTFVALARGMGIAVELRQDLRWEELGRSDILFVLYPTSVVVPRHVNSFIRGGGRVVIGDDFGRSERLFAELGLLRADAVGVGASSYYNDLAFAPMATATGGQALSENAEQLATNHPAIFTDLGPTKAVYSFGRGETVVSAGELGAGRLVALADPSVLINRMLQFDGNFGFAVNLLRYLSDSGSDTFSRRIVIVTGRFRLAGEPVENDKPADGLNGITGILNEWLGEINQYVVTQSTARGLTLLAASCLAFLLLGIVPLRSKSELDGNWTRARPLMAGSKAPDQIVAMFDKTTGARTSFLLPAAALRDGVARRLGEDLGYDDPFHGVPEHVLYRELETRNGDGAVRRLRPLYRQLKNLPSRSQADVNWDGRFISEREFERLSDQVAQLYRSLEASDHS